MLLTSPTGPARVSTTSQQYFRCGGLWFANVWCGHAYGVYGSPPTGVVCQRRSSAGPQRRPSACPQRLFFLKSSGLPRLIASATHCLLTSTPVRRRQRKHRKVVCNNIRQLEGYSCRRGDPSGGRSPVHSVSQLPTHCETEQHNMAPTLLQLHLERRGCVKHRRRVPQATPATSDRRRRDGDRRTNHTHKRVREARVMSSKKD